jgi:ubiquinone biosynthesis protein
MSQSETMSPTPPLPESADMIPHSAWLAARPGLRRAAEEWLPLAAAQRDWLADQAKELAEPSLGWASLSAVARTGGRVLSVVGTDGLADIFRIATDARRARNGIPPKRDRDGNEVDREELKRTAVEHAQNLVQAGGPAYVKLGQFIASARGLLPDEWVDAFAWCRDEVPPLRPGVAESIIERTFAKKPDEIFATFDPNPIAAASIAQVHKATLKDGTEVVVKVRRPGLRRKFLADIRVMALLFAGAERALAEARMANLSGFVELFAQIVLEELDFRLEAVNIIELALAGESADHDYVNYPRPVPELVATNVLVMERVHGVRYTDALQAYPDRIDGPLLMRLAIQSVLEQAMIYGKFHGDLHAGNVFVDENGHFSLVDFGIIGRFTGVQRAALVRFMIGFGQGDVRGQLGAMREFGAIPESADFERLVADLQVHADKLDALELRAGQTPKGLDELADAMSAILRLLTKSGFVLPKELVLFFKNVLYLNSLAASVAPGADLLAEIEPVFKYFAKKYPQAIEMMANG